MPLAAELKAMLMLSVLMDVSRRLPEPSDTFLDIAVHFRPQFDDDFNAKLFQSKHNLTCYGKITGLDVWHFRSTINSSQSVLQSVESRKKEFTEDEFSRLAVDDIYWGDPVQRSERKIPFSDPQYERQWYLHSDQFDYMNIDRVWREGYTGRNVTICVIDDGVDHWHEDLRTRYVFDFNDMDDEDHDPRPQPSHHAHGTKCAGVATAEANNRICGVGVAHGASLAGFRLLGGPMNSLLEARALAFLNTKIDIKSVSWGPTDNGKLMEKPGKIAQKSIEYGVRKGRGGKGLLFVWAAGNGGPVDHCGADGFSSNHNVFCITSVKQNGRHESYTEAGTNILAAVYVGRGWTRAGEQLYGVITTGTHQSCASDFTGTSAAAPLASGIFALLLEANPELSYRDVMHIVVETARIPPNPDHLWCMNGAGYHFHEYIGFGTMDAKAMIELGKQWKPVPQQLLLQSFKTTSAKKTTELRGVIHVVWEFEVANTEEINKIEHVVITLSMNTKYRGGVKIALNSPQKTHSVLLDYRIKDNSDEAIKEFPFTTNRCWGENPEGLWMLEFWFKPPPPLVRTLVNSFVDEIKIDTFQIYGT